MIASLRALGNLTGWRRNLLAFLLGVCATLTLAPFFLFPLLIPAFTGLYWLLQAAPSRRRMALDGWWWGWGFYMSGLYWFCIALLTDPEKFAWLIPFTLLGLMGVIALYSAAACWLLSWVRLRGISGILLFTCVWTLVEYARGHFLTGFPWNLPGYAFGVADSAMQPASLVGVYGLTWCAVLLGASFAALILSPSPLVGEGGEGGMSPQSQAVNRLKQPPLPNPPPQGGRGNVIFIIAVWAAFAASLGWGAWRLQEADRIPVGERYVDGVLLRLVQANIVQFHKWDTDRKMQGVEEYMRLTHQPGLDKVTHVIWPETAVPYTVHPDTPLAALIGRSVPPGITLITGSIHSEGEGRDWRVWNSIMTFDHHGLLNDRYDKSQLVPFGEFLPLRWMFPKEWLTPVGDTDFSRGPGVQTVDWPGLPPLSPLICYEVIFPELAAADAPRPQWMLNLTNDAWFGNSSGPYQHFEMARMRSVEQGLPLIRVANSGIMAVVDSWGRVEASMPLGESGILDSKLPKPQLYATLYSGFKNFFLVSLISLTVLLTVYQQRQRKN